MSCLLPPIFITDALQDLSNSFGGVMIRVVRKSARSHEMNYVSLSEKVGFRDITYFDLALLSKQG